MVRPSFRYRKGKKKIFLKVERKVDQSCLVGKEAMITTQKKTLIEILKLDKGKLQQKRRGSQVPEREGEKGVKRPTTGVAVLIKPMKGGEPRRKGGSSIVVEEGGSHTGLRLRWETHATVTSKREGLIDKTGTERKKKNLERHRKRKGGRKRMA